jgi:hypothetical protein
MTSVTLVRGVKGVFCSCEASGHASYAVSGSDIVCAAVSVLLRTAVQVLKETNGVVVTNDTASRGKLAFCVKVQQPDPETESRLICIADFIADGIGSIAAEYPEYVCFAGIDRV